MAKNGQTEWKNCASDPPPIDREVLIHDGRVNQVGVFTLYFPPDYNVLGSFDGKSYYEDHGYWLCDRADAEDWRWHALPDNPQAEDG